MRAMRKRVDRVERAVDAKLRPQWAKEPWSEEDIFLRCLGLKKVGALDELLIDGKMSKRRIKSMNDRLDLFVHLIELLAREGALLVKGGTIGSIAETALEVAGHDWQRGREAVQAAEACVRRRFWRLARPMAYT